MGFEYECALTGIVAAGGPSIDADGMEDLPVGWTRVRITRRVYNPEWLFLQEVKQAMTAAALAQVPPELHELQQMVVAAQVDAHFFAKEQATPMFMADIDDVAYISDSGAVVDGINELRDLLNLAPLVIEEDELTEDPAELTEDPAELTEAPAEAPAELTEAPAGPPADEVLAEAEPAVPPRLTPSPEVGSL